MVIGEGSLYPYLNSPPVLLRKSEGVVWCLPVHQGETTTKSTTKRDVCHEVMCYLTLVRGLLDKPEY